jgi:hypothetical protein
LAAASSTGFLIRLFQSVALDTLRRAASAVGRSLRIELV